MLASIHQAGHGAVQAAAALQAIPPLSARVIDTTNESFIFELTGASQKIDQFVELMRPLGLVEVSRTGVLSIQRGKDKAG